jgi:dipeptidase E
MKFYLSSYKLGSTENVEKFKDMIRDTNKNVAYIANAMDFSTDLERRKNSQKADIDDLKSIGLIPTEINLVDFFHKKDELENELAKFDIIRVRWWNTFVLRQAMKLSGFDEIIKNYYNNKKDIIYGAYSAWVCVLWPTLECLKIVDDPTQKPYGEYETIRDGLWILDYSIAPHYRSDHFESEDIEKEVQNMIDQKILFKALRDGEVIIIE